MSDIKSFQHFHSALYCGNARIDVIVEIQKQDYHNYLENSSSFQQSFGKAKKKLFHIHTILFSINKNRTCIYVYRRACISVYRATCKTAYRNHCIST